MVSLKPIQRRVLHLLRDRTTFLAVLCSSILLIVSGLSFGEAWLQWSEDKYAAVFNSFSNNLAGRSLQSRICQYVPIDVVYTWVNGSDPLLQDGLKHVKEKLHALSDLKHVKLKTKCDLDNCVPSHFISTDGLLPYKTKSENIRDQNSFLASSLVDVRDQNLICDHGHHARDRDDSGRENRTFLVMESAEAALHVARSNVTFIGLGVERYHIHHAYWTTDWTSPNAFRMTDHFILTKLPSTATHEKVIHLLPDIVAESVGRIHMYLEEHMAIVQILDPSLLSVFLREHKSLLLESGATVLVYPAYLIVALPENDDDEAFAMNRFSEREELKYSLRSLEKYAPWVRHIYIVTNGQIPHWLNLENPRLTIVTHKEIFENKSHLPTFSSPSIEANLFRIPGLSAKFLYFNDDVFLGEEVWPSDFYDAAVGQKVYFSWPLPDCAPGCPNSWIKDGYCDLVCNTTKCMSDGGDCLGKDIQMGFGALEDESKRDMDEMDEDQCSEGCLDPWLADGFCDDGCNVSECGYDLGDCGEAKYDRIHKMAAPDDTSRPQTVFNASMPKGVNVAFWDLEVFAESVDELALLPVTDFSFVRAASFSQHARFLTVILRRTPEAFFNLTLQGRDRSKGNAVILTISIKCDTLEHVPVRESVEYPEQVLPESVENIRASDIDMDLSDVDVSKINMTADTEAHLKILQEQLDSDVITSKGFNYKKTALLLPYVRRHLTKGGQLKDLLKAEEHNPSTAVHRKLMDAYGDSMLFVNELYTHQYGFSNRLAIPHMPHLVDGAVFRDLRAKFPSQWEATSSHQIRQSDDMQFSFSYFHFLINEMETFDIRRVFLEYDTDVSGTWSDREIRTLLARIHSLPLRLDDINSFEKIIIDCHTKLEQRASTPKPPEVSLAFERYYDSKLPLVTSFLVENCAPLVAFLRDSFGDMSKYRHQIVQNGEKYTSFTRITSNISQVVSALDDLRKHPKKFVCINDNTDPRDETANKMVNAVLNDYLESVLPVPSSFELPSDYRNKFLHTDELWSWQFYRTILSVMTYFCVFLLIVIAVLSYFKIDIDTKLARCCNNTLPLATIKTSLFRNTKDYTTV